MSQHSSGYDSGEDKQMGRIESRKTLQAPNIAVKDPNQIEPFNSTTSPANIHHVDDSADKPSVGPISAAPQQAQRFYQSDTQVELDDFDGQFLKDGYERDKNKGANDSNDEDKPEQTNELNKLQLFQYKSPSDAYNTSKIQTLREYIQGVQLEHKNPRTNFFDLSRDYYTGKYKGDNKRTITVKSYLITRDLKNYVKDLSMEIIQTNQGCMPIIKTYEYNAYNDKKFVKALKFYNYKSDCELSQQIIVDEGVLCDEFRTYDTSLLHFENSIIFYKREENWHKLQMYDVIKGELTEIEGYNIEEPIGDGIRYHVMFSSEIDKTMKSGKSTQKRYQSKDDKLYAFLEKHYVFCQSYCITEDITYINKSLIGFQLSRPTSQRKGKVSKSEERHDDHLPEINPPKARAQMDREGKNMHPIQYICHHVEDNEVKFIAFDSFHSYHFYLKNANTSQPYLSEYTKFYGNNETHLQPEKERDINNPDIDDNYKHNQIYVPFLKHKNGQFTIQKTKVELTVVGSGEVDQYFYMTDDNQYMLVYPNYQNMEQKKQIIFQLAKAHQYNPNPDIEYNYQDDYEVRQRDHIDGKYIKVSHICINDYRSKNYLKRSQHIRDIIKYESPFTIYDKCILSTDQQSNLIYIYQSQIATGENHIYIYNYENNIVNTKQANSLPIMIDKIESIENQLYPSPVDPLLPPPNVTYYINSRYRHTVSTQRMVKTNQPTKREVDLDKMEKYNKPWAEEIREKLSYNAESPCKYYDLEFKMNEKFTDNTVIVENPKGDYLSISTKLDTCKEDIKLQTYSRSKFCYTFFFTITNSKEDIPRHHYFAVKRSIQDVEELGKQHRDAIITMDREVVVFMNNEFKFTDNEGDHLPNYTSKMSFKELIELQKKEEQHWLVSLGFEKCMDNRTELDFVPIIYQERGSLESHHLIVYDVNTQSVIRHYSLLSNIDIRKKIRKTKQGFGTYILTRTSDVFHQMKQPFQKNGTMNVKCVAKYQVAGQYQLKEVYDHTQKQNPANCTIEFQEYCIHFNTQGQNRIQHIGLKQMLVSESTQEEREKTFDRLFIIPWLSKNQAFKGSQFILREFDNYSQMQVIRMLDQDINTLFQHSSETIQYGHQKFLTSEDSHSDYILVISSQQRQRVYMEHFFDNSESYWMHQRVIRKLLSMQLAKFEKFVLNDDFNALMRDEFYQAQEVLQGKSINDLCLSFPREVAIGLKQPKSQYQSINGSLIQEVANDRDDMMDIYENMRLCEKNLLIQLDFNFCSSLRIAAELNSNQAVKQLMTKIFDLNEIQYQEIFMLELPRLLQLPRIERLYPFLTRDYEEKMQNEKESRQAQASDDKIIMAKYLNFEDVINHPDLPPFLSKTKNYYTKYRFKDFHKENREIVNDLVNLNEYDKNKVKGLEKFIVPKKLRKRSDSTIQEEDMKKLQEQQDQKEEQIQKKKDLNIEVEHSAINFTKVIIGEKIRGIQENGYQQINFNDNHLASIFYIEDEEYLEFYDLEAVRKIIDFQFVRTREFLKFIMIFYVLGFLTPFVLSLSIEIVFFLNIIYNICLFTQIWFIMFEFLQMKEQKLDYFMDFWNFIDYSQFIFFFTLYCIKMKNQFMTDSMFEILLSALLLFQSFYKMIYFLRIFESFNNTYQISILIIKNMYCLCILCGMLILAFTKQYTVMHLGINDPDKNYDNLHSDFLKLAVQTYKQTRGAFEAPILDKTLASENQFYQTIMIFMNMFMMFLQEGIFVFLGVMFFSQILQFYERFTPVLPTYMYKTMAKFNSECYDIVDMFVPQRNFKVICFAIAKDYDKDTFGYPGFVRSIQRNILNNEAKITLERQEDNEILQTRHKKLSDTRGTVNGLRDLCERMERIVFSYGYRH